jgi:predicted hotdog family 3-hydroxylacyl-ACP dehydratase
MCWENADRQDEIFRLPFTVDEIIPQKSPMRLVDALIRVGDRSGEVSVTVSDEMPFVGEDGTLDEVAYLEMMAQSIAALNAFKHLGASTSFSEGYLVGAQELTIFGSARVADTLNISVCKDVRFGKFAILTATVSRSTTVLARGVIKIWHNTLTQEQNAVAGES